MAAGMLLENPMKRTNIQVRWAQQISVQMAQQTAQQTALQPQPNWVFEVEVLVGWRR